MPRTPWLVKPKNPFDLAKVDSGFLGGQRREEEDGADTALADLAARLFGLQERLWAEAKRSLLVVLQGMDTGGKDGTIRQVFEGVNPLGVKVTSFKAPSEEEKRHDFLWRAHKAVPGAGEIGIFNRSHYEDVLIVRVHGWVPEAEWRARYDAINDFERHLVEGGTTIVKFWLHISPKEQAKRLRARLDTEDKRWKFNPDDIEERKHWADYMVAATEMLNRTSTDAAPWYVVPADRKWYRNWVVSTVLTDTLAAMDPKYPVVNDLGDYVIPDV